MLLKKLSENMDSFRQKTVLGIFLFLIILPSFFSGEWSHWLQAAVFVVVFLLILYSVILSRDAKADRLARVKSWFSNPNFYLIIFLAAVLLTSFFSVHRYSSFSLFFLLLAYAAVYFSAYLFFRRWDYLKLVSQVIFLTGALAALIALIMFLSQSSSRAFGMLFNSNALGSYLLFSLPLGIVLSARSQGKKTRYFYIFSLLFIGLAFLLSYSYTAWAAFLLPGLILIWYYRRAIFTRKNLTYFAVILLVVFIVTVFFRYQNSHDLAEALMVHETISFNHFISSFSQRLYFIQSSLEIFADHPLTGVGYNTYQTVYGRYYHTVIEQPRYAHNYYLQTAAEIGLFGFLSLLAFVFFLLRRAYQAASREADPEKKVYLLGLGLALLGSAVHSLFDFGWQFPSVFLLFWITSGLIMAWRQKINERQTDQKEEKIIPKENKSYLAVAARLLAVILALAIMARGAALIIGSYYFQRAEYYAEQADIEKFSAYYESGLKYDPNPLKAVNYAQNIIKYPVKQEKLEEMENLLNGVIAAHPQDYFAYWVLGRTYFVEKKYDQAIAAYQQAIHYNPVFRPDFHYDLALTYFNQEEYRRAKEVILAILEEYPAGIHTSNPNLFTQLAFLNLLLGEVYFEEGDNQKAAIYYAAALELKPDFSLAQNRLSELKESE